jgi:hypothetical protein
MAIELVIFVAAGVLGAVVLTLAVWRLGAADRLRAARREMDNLAAENDGEYLG